jgi:hypothetical protein
MVNLSRAVNIQPAELRGLQHMAQAVSEGELRLNLQSLLKDITICSNLVVEHGKAIVLISQGRRISLGLVAMCNQGGHTFNTELN